MYYLPYKNEGRSNYPKGVYLPMENTASPDWIKTIKLTMVSNSKTLEFQSINEFNSVYPMQVIATVAETHAIIEKSKRTDYLVFPEDRMFPIKMKMYLPKRWVQKNSNTSFSGKGDKGEN